jgi:phytoene/squalene synthetase
MGKSTLSTPALAAAITRAASRQTYYTVRFLVDRARIPEAYQAYGYFRWVDDRLDQGGLKKPERAAFVERQAALLDACYRDAPPRDPVPEERMLTELIQSDVEPDSGLRAYLRQMMAVMAFDAERRGRLISQGELADYSRSLAGAVTEALHHFIGHGSASPRGEARYLAATAAHITHMLRDTFEDVAAGYYNIPREYLDAHQIAPQAVASEPYRAWVKSRVQLARAYFKAGRGYLAQVENLRCRFAGYAYIARFEWVLDAIERDRYQLRPAYQENASLETRLRKYWATFGPAVSRPPQLGARVSSIQPHPRGEL